MRRSSTPPLDLVPVMGLAALLIPLLLMGQGGALAVIEADLPPGCTIGRDPYTGVVPIVVLGVDGIGLRAAGERHTLAKDQLPRLAELLDAVADAHETNGTLILETESDVDYERLIAVMDAVRPHFPHVTLAGGPP
ncbi:MAG: hypothetical protein R3F61_20520 [Myxococcota bacterium]